MPADCAFCSIVTGRLAAHVVLSEPDVVGFLDARPVFKGHVLVVPRTHHETLADLSDPLLVPVFAAARRVAAALEPALGCHGSFVAVNNRVSQSVPHLHVHVVPRRFKDGLRGFFWPRQRYDGDADMGEHADRIRAALDAAPA